MLAKDQDVSISSQMLAYAHSTRGATTIVWAAGLVVEAHIIVTDCRDLGPAVQGHHNQHQQNSHTALNHCIDGQATTAI